MNTALIWASSLITIALGFYLTGFIQSLKKKYPHSFWFFFLGWLIFDVPGTVIMYTIAGQIKFNWHTIPGMIGFVLMAIAAIMGLSQIIRFQQSLMTWFKPIETAGCIIWIFSYIVGVAIRIF